MALLNFFTLYICLSDESLVWIPTEIGSDGMMDDSGTEEKQVKYHYIQRKLTR
jgi:hypothetical protein